MSYSYFITLNYIVNPIYDMRKIESLITFLNVNSWFYVIVSYCVSFVYARVGNSSTSALKKCLSSRHLSYIDFHTRYYYFQLFKDSWKENNYRLTQVILMAKPYEKFSKVYDAFMKKDMGDFYHNYFRFISVVLRKLNKKPDKILDIACGSGILAKLLMDKSYDIQGLDVSENMLKVARRKGVTCRKGDIRNFKIQEKFDLVICTFDSLNYILTPRDLQKSFKSVNKHLNKNGVFIFDMNSDYKINKIAPKFLTQFSKTGNVHVIWLNSHKPNRWIAEMIMFDKSGSGYKKFYEKHIEKAYKFADITRMLKKSSFKIMGVYSDFKLNKVKKNSSRWFFVVRKK